MTKILQFSALPIRGLQVLIFLASFRSPGPSSLSQISPAGSSVSKSWPSGSRSRRDRAARASVQSRRPWNTAGSTRWGWESPNGWALVRAGRGPGLLGQPQRDLCCRSGRARLDGPRRHRHVSRAGRGQPVAQPPGGAGTVPSRKRGSRPLGRGAVGWNVGRKSRTGL